MLRALFFLIFGSLVISALISPSIFIIIKNFFPMLPWPYSRLFDRVLMVVIFIFLLILRKDFSITDAINKFKEMPKRKALKEIIIALNISLGISIVLAFFLNMQDRLLWEAKDISYYLGKIPKAILSALVISILEESFFRVVLFNSFKKKLNIFIAMSVSSLCYAMAHFIAPAKTFVFTNLTLTTGFEYYVEVLKTMFFPNIFCAFFGLFLVGFGLCFLIHKFSSIYINIGLHSGWVIAMKLFIYSTHEAPNVVMNPMERRYFLVEQNIGWLSIVIVFMLAFFIFTKKEKATNSI